MIWIPDVTAVTVETDAAEEMVRAKMEETAVAAEERIRMPIWPVCLSTLVRIRK